jgi:hypothetical protein
MLVFTLRASSGRLPDRAQVARGLFRLCRLVDRKAQAGIDALHRIGSGQAEAKPKGKSGGKGKQRGQAHLRISWGQAIVVALKYPLRRPGARDKSRHLAVI